MMGHKSSGKKFLSTTALTLGLMALAGPALAMDDFTTPTGEQVVGGAASFDRPAAGTLNVNQSTDRVVINWDSFNIGAKGKTEFFQPGAGSLAVNRVTGADSNPTQILGTLKSNGRVMVLDRNGILFGANAVLDVGGIVASTGDVDTGAVMRGDTVLTLTNFGDGSVVNNGLIRVADAGLAAFVAPHVANNGVISARMGKVALAAGGESATVDLYGDGLVELAVGGSSGKALAENAGTINAEGGNVLMSAAGAKGVVDNVINMSGVVHVASVTQKGGKIILSGGKNGKVDVSGTANASGATGGGEIRVTGAEIHVAPSAFLLADANDSGHGGTVYTYADNNAIFRGNVFARGGAHVGNGGFVEVSAANQLGYDGTVNTMAVNGVAGTFLLDPQFAIIHSGTLHNPLGFQYILSARSLANDLARNGALIVQADDYIDVGTDLSLPFVGSGDVNLADYNYTTTTPTWTQICVFGTCFPFFTGFETTTHTGITSGTITLDSDTVNFNKNLIIGTSNLVVDANTLNLDGSIYGKAAIGAPLALVGNAKLVGTNALTNINVLSSNARISQAVAFADSSANKIINVAADTYNESVTVNNGKLQLLGTNAIVAPNSPGFTVTANNVTIDGFEITGADHGIVVNNASNVTLRNNWIHNLVSGSAVQATDARNLTVTGNTFDGGISGLSLGGSGVTLGTAIVANNFFNGISGKGIEIGASAKYGSIDVFNNSFTGYASGATRKAIDNGNTDLTVDASGNYWGATNESTVNNRIAGWVDFTPYLMLSTDASGATGFQGDFSQLFVTAQGRQTGPGLGGLYGTFHSSTNQLRINEAISLLDNGTFTGSNREVHLGSGTFTESVQVNKSLRLLGHYAGFDPNIVARGDSLESVVNATANNALTITASDVLIDGITASGQNGIVVAGGVNNTNVRNNRLLSGNHGVFDAGSANLTVSNSVFTGQNVAAIRINGAANLNIHDNGMSGLGGSGILLENINGALVDRNTVSAGGAGDGVSANNVSGLTVTGNTISGGQAGIEVLNTNNAIIGGVGIGDANTVSGSVIGIQINNSDNATVSSNTVNNSGWDAVQIVNGSDNAQVLGNDINGVSGASGIAVMAGSHNAVLDGNTIDDVARLGIYVWNSNSLSIRNNQINNAGLEGGTGRYLSGIHLEGANATTIEDNTVQNTGGSGIHIGGPGNGYALITTGNTVRNNTVFATTGDGVSARDSNGVSITGNMIGQAGNVGDDGISVYGSAGAQITGNTVSNATNNGIEAQHSDDVLIADNNNVNFVGGDGVFVDQSDRAVIRGNMLGNIEGDGVDVRNGRNIRIRNNAINGTGDNGIEATNADHLRVISNDIGLFAAIGGDGIHARGSNNLLVEENTLRNIVETGIDVRNANGTARLESGEGDDTEYFNVIIHDNDVSGTANGDGIYVRNAGASLITDNQIGSTGNDGISVVENGYARISDNMVNFAGDDGISVRDGGEADVTDNLVLFSMNDGITARDMSYVNIEDNLVLLSFRNGIHVRGGEEADIRNNLVALSGVDGITVEDTGDRFGGDFRIAYFDKPGWNVRISGNKVVLSGRHGISAFDTGSIRIRNNEVALSGTDFTGWIEDLLGGGFGYETVALVDEEGPGDILDFGFTLGWGNGDGIHVEGADRFYGYGYGDFTIESDEGREGRYRSRPAVSIVGNDVRWSGGDGIEVRDSGSVRIARNNVEASGINATSFTLGGLMSHFSALDFNTVMEGFNDAFLGEGSMNDFLAYVLPVPDDVTWGSGDGIHVENVYGDDNFGGSYFEGFEGLRNRDFAVRILNNTVAGAGGDGIEVRDSNWTLVADNTVTASGLYNDWCPFPDFETDFWSDGNYSNDDYEDFRIGGNGISVSQMSFPDIFSFNQEGYGPQSVSVIAGNAVTDAGENGVRTEGLDAVLIDRNIVRNSGAANLFVAGANNGDVVLTGNEFIFDNEVEGDVEQIGALFESGIIDLTGEANRFTGGTKGMVFDPAETWPFPFPWFPLFGEGSFEFPWISRAHMELVDNTIGTTIFAGQSQYYIELRNGAFFDPGTPTIIDGLNASYDGFTPASVGGFLTAAQYLALESRIHHYNDDATLGLFFFGLAPVEGVDQEDIFNRYAGFNPGTGSLTITLTGLPNLGGGNAGGNNGGGNGNLASFLASIAPAAGGEEGEGEELASLAPSAGNTEEAACWSEAAAQASAGAAVSYTLSGTIENILNQAVACGSD